MILYTPFTEGVQSAGGLTLTTWKGKPIAKKRIRFNNSKTPAQVFQRDKFKFVKDLQKLFGNDYTKAIWTKFENQTTYINEFMSSNLPLQPAFVDPFTPFSGDPAAIFYSRGSLEKLASPTDPVYDDTVDQVQVSWSDTVVGNGDPDDTVYLVALDMVRKVRYISGEFARNDQAADVEVPSGLDPADFLAILLTFQELADGTIIYADSFQKVCVAP